MDLDAQFKRLHDKIEFAVEETVRHIAQTTYEFITPNVFDVGGGHGSPVLTGRYYTSHRIALNTTDLSVAGENPDRSSPYAPLPPDYAEHFLHDFKMGDQIIISNALDYAAKIEYDRASPKTPEGVYQVSLDAALVEFRVIGGQHITAAVNTKFPPVTSPAILGVAA